jgi:hypothetical protein
MLQVLQHAPRRLVSAAAAWPAGWPVASQQHARRNALVASTAMAQRRMEQADVEEFLAALGDVPRPRSSTGPAVSHTA